MRHKHADVIHAWAEGAEVQCKREGRWETDFDPNFFDSLEYRIKPKTGKYRVAIFKSSSDGKIFTDTEDFEEKRNLCELNDFIRYLTDWIEYDI